MAVGPDDVAALASAFTTAGLPELLRLGVVTAEPAVRLLSGEPLGRLGWQHGETPPVG
jgi:hypothetical protein